MIHVTNWHRIPMREAQKQKNPDMRGSFADFSERQKAVPLTPYRLEY